MAKPVARRGEGRERVLRAALKLFAEHGVSGTSLQMIADELGVTKAAVFYQFHSKDDIVLAVLAPAFEQMAVFLEQAEAAPSRAAQVEATLAGMIDLAVTHRHAAALLHRDPAAAALVSEHAALMALLERLGRMLTGPAPDAARRVAVAMVGGGIMLSGADPELQQLDDADLRAELLRASRQLLLVSAPT